MTAALCIFGYILVGAFAHGTLVCFCDLQERGEYDGIRFFGAFVMPFWPIVLPICLAHIGGERMACRIRERREARERERYEQERLLREAGL